MQHNKLALIVGAALACAGALSACADRPTSLARAPDAPPLSPTAAIWAADWNNAAPITITLTEYAVAPDDLTLVVGEPVRLQIRNTGQRSHMFAASRFFDAVAVRTVASGPFAAPPAPKGYKAHEMEQIAYHGVGQIIRLTPHEEELARTSRNPFDKPPAPPTPIDFGDLLGDLGALGADPFGLNAPAPAEGAGAAAQAAPANPFDILGALGGAAKPAEPAAVIPPPAPKPAPADEARAAGVAVAEGIALEHEDALLREWGPGQLAGIGSFEVAPGEAIYVTLVPLKPGTYGVSTLRAASLLGMRGTVRIVSAAPPPAEVAPPAAGIALPSREAKN